MTDALSLSALANIAEIIGAGAVVTGFVFGWIQLRHYRVQQRAAVAADLMATFYSSDLAHAMVLLQSVPDGISLAELRAKGVEYEEAAVKVCTSYETMGVLAFQRIAPFDLVLDLAGGVLATMFHKLNRFVEDLRAELQQPSWGEWFEWLSDQVEEAKIDREPAHILHRDWRP
ncbi:MAG: hypothetical protein GY723_03395 [bacterium]|nr:hypothetical protein [bacterium]